MTLTANGPQPLVVLSSKAGSGVSLTQMVLTSSLMPQRFPVINRTVYVPASENTGLMISDPLDQEFGALGLSWFPSVPDDSSQPVSGLICQTKMPKSSHSPLVVTSPPNSVRFWIGIGVSTQTGSSGASNSGSGISET